MVSISSSPLSFLPTSVNISSNSNNIFPYSLYPFSKKQHQSSKHRKPKHHRHQVACSGSTNQNNNPAQEPANSDILLGNRRDVLIGLGGLYGATTLINNNNNTLAFGAPIPGPDLTNCGLTTNSKIKPPINCCPPIPTKNIIDFKFPSYKQLRVRPAAQLVNDDYLSKYKKALELMKSLPLDDPRSFTQQANVHCAYCEGAYKQLNSDKELQVHASWLFFPFHRLYLYFYERILGSLINDPTFALPFWNWDAPDGMQIPLIYNDPNSPLFDPLRNSFHQPPKTIDLDYSKTDDDDDTNTNTNEQIISNLCIMHDRVICKGRKPNLFLGSAYGAGDASHPGAGSLEHVHNIVHSWTGDKRQPRGENMGINYAAARDPIFYSHHANVDRIWSIWKTLGKKRKEKKRKDFTDPDWLESSFLFYDENKNLVRVKVKDCLDERKLGYVHQDVGIPWENSRPTPRRLKSKVKREAEGFGIGDAQPRASSRNYVKKFPIVLDSVVSRVVKRPKKSRSVKEKEEEEEVLVVEGIEFDGSNGVKFDVFVNDEDYKEIRVDDTEFAGSFVTVPHSHKHEKKNISTTLRIGLTCLLDDLEAGDDDSVVVTLVPRYGDVKISGIKIVLEE